MLQRGGLRSSWRVSLGPKHIREFQKSLNSLDSIVIKDSSSLKTFVYQFLTEEHHLAVNCPAYLVNV